MGRGCQGGEGGWADRRQERKGEMMMMSVDRQGELNLLISQSGKKAT